MGDVRTNIEFGATTKGFDSVINQANRAIETVTKGVAKQKAGFDGMSQSAKVADKEALKLQKQLQELTIKQLELNETLQQMGDKGSKAYKQISGAARAIDSETSRVERSLKRIDNAFSKQEREAKKAEKARLSAARAETQAAKQTEQAATKAAAAQAKAGSFRQGFAQGAVPGVATFLQRGPGMGRQMAGMAAGGAARGAGRIAGGLGSMAFSGAAGLTSAVSAIPGIGGAAASMLSTGLGQARQALGLRQQEQQALPYLGGLSLGGAQTRAGMAASAAAGRGFDKSGYAPAAGDVTARLAQLRAGESERSVKYAMKPNMTQAEMMAAGTEGGRQIFRGANVSHKYNRDVASEQLRQEERKRVTGEAAIAAREGVRGDRLPDIKGVGERFGMDRRAATQLAASISQAAGGTGRELKSQGFLEMGAAAQTMGMDAGTTGAFMGASRRGGAVGARGQGTGVMTEAIQSGLRLGLEGSDLNEYMANMAGDIRAWKQTGIPLNTDTVGKMGRAFAKAGLGGTRGAVAGRALVGKAQALSSQGPQSASDIAMLKAVGYEGGGLEDLEAAQLKLEQGAYDPEKLFQKMASQFNKAGGGGIGGRYTMRSGMEGLGVKLGIEETQLMQAKMEGTLSDKQQQRLKQIQKESRPGKQLAGRIGKEGFVSAAEGAIDPVLREQAKIANLQIKSGEGLLDSMLKLDKSTATMGAKFSELVDGPLLKLTGSVEVLTKQFTMATTEFTSTALTSSP